MSSRQSSGVIKFWRYWLNRCLPSLEKKKLNLLFFKTQLTIKQSRWINDKIIFSPPISLWWINEDIFCVTISYVKWEMICCNGFLSIQWYNLDLRVCQHSRLKQFLKVLWSHCFIQVVLHLSSSCSSARKFSFWYALINFSLSATHFKVGCRQSKVKSLLNLFSPCLHTVSCEIAEQQPRQYRDFENIHRELPREHIWTSLAPSIHYVCCCATKCVKLG